MKNALTLCCCLLLTSCFVKKERNEQDYNTKLKELKIASASELSQIYPEPYNLTAVVEKGICNNKNFCLNFLYIQALYRKALDQYFMEKLDLKKYDDLLAKSSLRFIRRSGRESMYQKNSTMSLEYIYLHNNIYIERLDKKTLHFLQSRIDNNKLDVDAELIDVVQKTYPQLIEVFSQEKVPTLGLYSPDGVKLAPNNAVIFEIGHQSEFDKNGNYVSRENEALKDAFLKKLIPKMETEFSKKLNCPVTIFVEK